MYVFRSVFLLIWKQVQGSQLVALTVTRPCAACLRAELDQVAFSRPGPSPWSAVVQARLPALHPTGHRCSGLALRENPSSSSLASPLANSGFWKITFENSWRVCKLSILQDTFKFNLGSSLGVLSTVRLNRRHLPPCRADLTKLCTQGGPWSDPAQECVLTLNPGTLLMAQSALSLDSSSWGPGKLPLGMQGEPWIFLNSLLIFWPAVRAFLPILGGFLFPLAPGKLGPHLLANGTYYSVMLYPCCMLAIFLILFPSEISSMSLYRLYFVSQLIL